MPRTVHGVVGDSLGIGLAALIAESSIAVEDVGSELNFLALDAAPEVAATLSECLAHDVPAGHLDRRAGHLKQGSTGHLLARDPVDRESLCDPSCLEWVEADVERLRLEYGRSELRASV